MEQKLRENALEDLFDAINHYAGQTIVSLCTTFEVAAKDFFVFLFKRHPEYMYEFLGNDESKGMVSLKEIVKSKNYDEMISRLSEIAATSAVKGRYSQTLKKIAKLCGKQDVVSEELIANLNNIQNKRNKIVHEKYEKEWDFSEIEDAEKIISNSIETICICGRAAGVPGKYTCIESEVKIFMTGVVGLMQQSEKT